MGRSFGIVPILGGYRHGVDIAGQLWPQSPGLNFSGVDSPQGMTPGQRIRRGWRLIANAINELDIMMANPQFQRMKERKFTVAQGLKIQAEHVAAWGGVLKPEVFAALVQYVAKCNQTLHPDATGYDVTRGGGVDEFVHNYAMGLWQQEQTIKTNENKKS
jgi:hypothetical protein